MSITLFQKQEKAVFLKPHPTHAMATKTYIIFICILTVLVTPIVSLSSNRFSNIQPSRSLGLENINDSIELAIGFMLNNQKPLGNFNYSYNWQTKNFDPNDNSVRQAGSVWGVTLVYQDRPERAILQHVKKGLDYFNGSSVNRSRYRYISYGNEEYVKTGTVSLVALAHIEVLRSHADHFSKEEQHQLNHYLDGYLGYLAHVRKQNGLFESQFSFENHEQPIGKPDPYSSGEALLALIKAAKYLDRRELIPNIMKSADTMYTEFVINAQKENPDSATTKGFYQWGTMSYFELATSGWQDTEKYADRVIEMADWMIDVHRTTSRRKNTGYAQEGIIHAYEMARLKMDKKHMDKFKLVSNIVLKKLISWQVGHPLANSFIKNNYKHDDILALGGFQNQKNRADLRIDVTQHTLHACLLARRYLNLTIKKAPVNVPSEPELM